MKFPMLAGGLELFADLLQRFPNNTHLLLEMAKVRLAAISYNSCNIPFQPGRLDT